MGLFDLITRPKITCQVLVRLNTTTAPATTIIATIKPIILLRVICSVGRGGIGVGVGGGGGGGGGPKVFLGFGLISLGLATIDVPTAVRMAWHSQCSSEASEELLSPLSLPPRHCRATKAGQIVVFCPIADTVGEFG